MVPRPPSLSVSSPSRSHLLAFTASPGGARAWEKG